MSCFCGYPGAPGAPHGPPAEGLKISPSTRSSSRLAAAPYPVLGPAGAAVRAFPFCRTVAVLSILCAAVGFYLLMAATNHYALPLVRENLLDVRPDSVHLVSRIGVQQKQWSMAWLWGTLHKPCKQCRAWGCISVFACYCCIG
ncbi:hypothetical protein SVAN01_04094 [Stagonosporopsis vannaccii]|nr:hypothetical protein SVAN01_04094 [Stagonosporopsis vannaccii]